MGQIKKIILIIIMVIMGLLVITTLILLPPSNGDLPAFYDENGAVLTNSIVEKTWVDINGSKLGLIIIGEDKNNPILLVCGGGPGIPEYLMESFYPSVLTKHFVVVYFDYRGTGLSYEKVDPNKMTTKQYLNDVDTITDYIRNRFNTEKIYLMGHSFGTYIGLNAAHNHPEKYDAYFAMSQMTIPKKSEIMAYDYMLNEYKKRNDSSKVSEFEKYPIKDSEEAFVEYRTSSLRDDGMHELGVGTTRNMSSVIYDIFFPSLRCKAYTMVERINIWRGKIASNKFKVTADGFNYNTFEKIKSIDIPIYFFAGKYDYTCNEELQRKYYEFIKAPNKKYYLYENSSHSPVFEDNEMTDNVLKEILNK